MDLFVWQIIFVVSIFLAVIICCLIPILILRKAYTSDANYVCIRLLSWCNCLTGGLFLALCFLSLLPNVQEQITAVLAGLNYHTTFPLAECVVLMGFFIVLTIDQASRSCEKPKKPTRREFEMAALRDDEYDSVGDMDEDAHRTLLFDDDEEMTNRTSDGDLSHYSDAAKEVIGSRSTGNSAKSSELHTPSVERRPEAVHYGQNGGHHSHEQVINLIATSPRGLQLIVLLFALSMHALFEGIVLGLQKEVPKAVHLFTAIILHEAVVAATLGFNIAKAKHSIWTAVRYSLLFSVTIPIGIGLGIAIGQTPGIVGHLISGSLQGIAAGIFLHITFMQLLPDEFADGKNGLVKTLFLFIGFLLLMLLKLVLGVKH